MKSAATTGMSATHPGFGPLILIVDHHEWSARALESVVAACRFNVERAYTGECGLAKARTKKVGLVFVGHRLSDGDAVGFCRALRDEPAFRSYIPILVTASEPLARSHRLALLQAGAWDVLTRPLDPEEIVYKLQAYDRARREVDEISEACLIDQLTGLYSRRGLERRAVELRSEASRSGRGLVCVAMERSSAALDARDTADDATRRTADSLRTTTRASDAVGRLRNAEFAIFAPITDAEGPLRLAHRLAGAIRSADAPGTSGEPTGLRAGYDFAPDPAEQPIENLLLHATKALSEAKSGSDQDWIRPFQSGSTSP
jgi:diguanylate cyclase (GGDEF)-like protein